MCRLIFVVFLLLITATSLCRAEWNENQLQYLRDINAPADSNVDGDLLSWDGTFKYWKNITQASIAPTFVSDTAYGASWNGVTTIAPSKNAVYDKIETLGGTGDITSVGDVSSGAAFDGTQGTTLTFYNAGGNATFSYDGTDFFFQSLWMNRKLVIPLQMVLY